MSRPILVDPARREGRYFVVDLPAVGPVLLPGDVVPVTDGTGRAGIARVGCVDFARKRLYLGVLWPRIPQPLPILTRTPAGAAPR